MTYSFLNTAFNIVGPGLAANLGAGAQVAEEGITLAPSTDKNEMDIGVDGLGQHSLIANDSGRVTVKLQKTSPMNALLMAAYDFQSQGSNFWGQNQATITDAARGDLHVLVNGAFKKKPEINQKKDAGFIEWEFDFTQINSILGS